MGDLVPATNRMGTLQFLMGSVTGSHSLSAPRVVGPRARMQPTCSTSATWGGRRVKGMLNANVDRECYICMNIYMCTVCAYQAGLFS